MHLGLRPRLKARPSLLDLVTRKDIDRLSARPLSLEIDGIDAELSPTRVPLPKSPRISPERGNSEVEVPRIVIESEEYRQLDNKSEDIGTEDKMAGVGAAWTE